MKITYIMRLLRPIKGLAKTTTNYKPFTAFSAHRSPSIAAEIMPPA
jgi:hypothetical protein